MKATAKLTNPISGQQQNGTWNHAFVGSVSLDGTAPFTYSWQVPSNAVNVTGQNTAAVRFNIISTSSDAAGVGASVTVTVTDSTGCTAIDTASTISPIDYSSGSGSGDSGSGSGIPPSVSGGSSSSGSGTGGGSGMGSGTVSGGGGGGTGSGTGVNSGGGSGSGIGSNSGSGGTSGSGSGSGSGISSGGGSSGSSGVSGSGASGSGISGGSGMGSGTVSGRGGGGTGSGTGVNSGSSGGNSESGISGSGASGSGLSGTSGFGSGSGAPRPDCCPDLFYYDPIQKKCVEAPLCPQASPVPLLSNKRGGAVTVSFAAWPRFGTSVDLFQNGARVHSFAAPASSSGASSSGASGSGSGGGALSFDATGLLDFQTYSFTLQARNDKCSAPLSSPVSITMTSDALALAWETPAANQDVRGPLALVGDVQSAIGLTAQNPVQMLLGGSVLDGTNQFGVEDANHKTVWVNRFDPLGADFEGDMTFRLFARDSLGLPKFLDVTVHVALSLAKLTRYEHDGWAEPTGKTWSKVALTATFDTREPLAWVDVFLTSPGKGIALPYDDFAAMETELQKWQNVPFDAPITVLADPKSGPSALCETVRRFTPAQIETRFALNATHVARARRIPLAAPSAPSSSASASDCKLEVLTLDPARIVEVTTEGVSVVFDITKRGLTGVVDARRWRDDKVVVVTTSGVWVCDIDGAQADFDVKLSFKSGTVWMPENKPCVGVEVLDASAFTLAFADSSGSRLWKVDGTNPTLTLETGEQIVMTRAQQDGVLAFVTASHKILNADGFLLFAHSAPITELLFAATAATSTATATGVVGFCDMARVYSLSAGVASLVGEVGAQGFDALGWYQGQDAAPRVVAGGSGGGLWRRQNGGAFLPFWTVEHGANRVAGLGRFIQTFVAAVGDPLQGGTPAVTSEVAVALVETGAPQNAFVALVERSRQTSDTSVAARGVQWLVVTPA